MLKVILFAVSGICIFYLIRLIFSGGKDVEERLSEIGALGQVGPVTGENTKKKEKKWLQYVRVPFSVRMSVLSAGITLRVEELMVLWISVTFLPPFLYYMLTGQIINSVLLSVMCALSLPFYINVRKKKRLAAFGNQLGDALLLISNGLRAGFSFEQVLESVSKDLPAPISQEFQQVSRELRMGMTLEDSLNSMTERMENTDLRLLTSAVLIQRKVGGNLAEILDTISDTIRDRIRIKNYIQAQSAQGKLSGLIVGSIPVILFIALSFLNRDYMSIFYETDFGKLLLVIAVFMETAGFLIIRKMVNIES